MKNFHNIEKSLFEAKTYIGYSADGRSWRIRGGSGNWSAYANVTCAGSTNVLIGFDRIAEISKELEAIG
jgi:hypothetical protein